MKRLVVSVAVLAVASLSGCSNGGIDPCVPSPCEHEATCLPEGSGFVCLCPVGYAGATCEVNADDCDPNPCFHGGSCTDAVDGFTCACAPGFSGVQCETDVDDCSGSPCANAGICIDQVDGYACACAPGFTGATCGTDVDDCAPNPCYNGGTCVDGIDAFTCTCPTGFLGRFCEAAAYDASFEGACPNGWTLTGDFQCGVPSGAGPSTAFGGTQCLATQIAGPYSNNQTWTGATATSPGVLLAAGVPEKLTFRAWVDTEGSTYDGFHVEISTDGGMTYAVLTSVSPAYPLTIDGQPAWGGHQSALGWQLFEADLAAYAGHTVRIRFAFRSDSSGSSPGVYIDDVHVGS